MVEFPDQEKQLEYQCFYKCRRCGTFLRLGVRWCECGCIEVVAEVVGLDVLASLSLIHI